MKSNRKQFKHSCGYEFSIKIPGVSITRICPGCKREIDITQLRIYKLG